MGKYHPVLNLHLQKINNVSKNRISFLSNISQNKVLDIMKEYVRSIILEEVKQSQMFCIIIDTTTDLSSLEQVVFVLRLVMADGNEIRILRKSAKSGFRISDFRLKNPDFGF